jgi:hypothetical protein
LVALCSSRIKLNTGWSLAELRDSGKIFMGLLRNFKCCIKIYEKNAILWFKRNFEIDVSTVFTKRVLNRLSWYWCILKCVQLAPCTYHMLQYILVMHKLSILSNYVRCVQLDDPVHIFGKFTSQCLINQCRLTHASRSYDVSAD